MKITPITPSEALRPYVVAYMVLSNDDKKPAEFKMVPRNYSAIIINAPGADTIGNYLGGKDESFKPGNMYYGGLGLLPATMIFSKNVNSVFVLVRPNCSGMLLNEKADIFRDATICITDLNDSTRELSERFFDTNLPMNMRIHLLEKFLFKAFIKHEICAYTKRAMDTIHQSNGLFNINEISSHSYTCTRNLQRLFLQHLGMSPKKYCSIIRFNSLIKQYMEQPEISLKELALQFEYYDLSHLNKEAMRYLGSSAKSCVQQDQTINKVLL